MAELKTQKNERDVMAYLNSVEHEKRREDVDMDVLRELVAKSAEHVAKSNAD